MRRSVMLLCVCAFLGCGKTVVTSEPRRDPRPTTGRELPPQVPPQVERKRPAPEVVPPEAKLPPPVSPKQEPRLSLADARVKILNSDKAGVKALLGPPDETRMGTFNGVNTVVWVYRRQRVIWDGDAEKYYPLVAVSFYHKIDDSDPGNAVQVEVP